MKMDWKLLLMSLFLLALVFVRIAKVFLLYKIYKRKYGKDVLLKFWLFGFDQKTFDQEKVTGDSLDFVRALIKENPKTKVILSVGVVIEVVLLDPQLIRQFNLNQGDYYKSTGSLTGDYLVSRGLLYAPQSAWFRQRKLLSTYFTFEQLKERLPAIKSHCEMACKQVETSKPIKILTICQGITAGVIMQSFFSDSFSSLDQEQNSFIKEFNSIFLRGVSVIQGNAIVFFKYLLLQKWAAKIRIIKEQKDLYREIMVLREKVLKLIKKRAQERRSGNRMRISKKNDFLDIYMDFMLDNKQSNKIGMSEAEIFDEIVDQFNTFLFAGTDTTSRLAAMMIYSLAEHPEMQDEVKREIKQHIADEKNIQHSELGKLEFLHQFTLETLRLFTPAVVLISRRASKDTKIKDLNILRDTRIKVSLTFFNHNPLYFQDPQTFDPQRWSRRDEKDLVGFLPFSSGPRNCIGQHMAIIEAQMIIIYFLTNFQISRNAQIPLKFQTDFTYGPDDENLVFFQQI